MSTKKIQNSFSQFSLQDDFLNAIRAMGFKKPTPIQKKAIPRAMNGVDCVCMARTGSGKTMAFLLPIVQRLSPTHASVVGCRSVILSPTRELASQIYEVAKQLCRATSLRLCLLIGGHGLEGQFERLSSNPDLIIATPGRLVHHIEGSELCLQRCEIVVFDEADRLFEMGFAADLQVILRKMPRNRQCLFFSATIPPQLGDFVTRFITADCRPPPEIIKADEEYTLPDDLDLFFFVTQTESKTAGLLKIINHLQSKRDSAFASLSNTEISVVGECDLNLKKQKENDSVDVPRGIMMKCNRSFRKAEKIEVYHTTLDEIERSRDNININYNIIEKHELTDNSAGTRNGKTKMKHVTGRTLIFVSTRHHVEFLVEFIRRTSPLISVAGIYGTMDQSCRDITISKFREKKINVLIATDLAARGVDIPLLEYVISYDFPANPKVFIHRCGRTARAGASGLSLSILTHTDMPYLADLCVFLGKKIVMPEGGLIKHLEHHNTEVSVEQNQKDLCLVGGIPSMFKELEIFNRSLREDVEIQRLSRSMNSAHQLYLKTRQAASKASIKRTKIIISNAGGIRNIFLAEHPFFKSNSVNSDITENVIDEGTNSREVFLRALNDFRPTCSTLVGLVCDDLLEGVRKNHDTSVKFATHKERIETSDTSVFHISTKTLEGEEMNQNGKKLKHATGVASNTVNKLINKLVIPKRIRDEVRRMTKIRGSIESEKRFDPFIYHSNYYMDSVDPNINIINTDSGERVQFTPSEALYDKEVIDFLGEEADDLRVKKSVMRWDKRKRKYLPTIISADKTIDKHNNNNKGKQTKNIYNEWSRRTKKRIQQPGEAEDKNCGDPRVNRNSRTGTQIRGSTHSPYATKNLGGHHDRKNLHFRGREDQRSPYGEMKNHDNKREQYNKGEGVKKRKGDTKSEVKGFASILKVRKEKQLKLINQDPKRRQQYHRKTKEIHQKKIDKIVKTRSAPSKSKMVYRGRKVEKRK